MKRPLLSLLLLLALVGAGCAAETSESQDPAGETARVVSHADGDTVLLSTGDRVRLLQIDTPETHGQTECYGKEASAALKEIMPAGAEVRLEPDPATDDVDRYGRLLRYLFADGVNVNLEMVRRGAAAPYFYQGERGRYAEALLAAAKEAEAKGRGLWGACFAELDPTRAVTTLPRGGALQPAPPANTPSTDCHPSYQGVCLPTEGPDLDCADVDAPPGGVRVRGDDPYRLDGDGDGVACAS